MRTQGSGRLGRPSLGVLGGVLGLAWMLGLAAHLQQAALWPEGAAVALSVAAMLSLIAAGLTWARGWRLLSTVCLALAFAAAAFGSSDWRAQQRLNDALPAALEGQDLVVTGVISGLPRVSLQGTRFVLDADSASLNGQAVPVPQRLSLGWYRGFDDQALLGGPPVDLRAGQRWQLTVRLRQPHGSFNPHGFDLELWLFEQGIRAGGSVRATPGNVNQLLAARDGQYVARARQAVRDAIDALVPDS